MCLLLLYVKKAWVSGTNTEDNFHNTSFMAAQSLNYKKKLSFSP